MRTHALAAVLLAAAIAAPASFAAGQRIEVRAVDDGKQPIAGVEIAIAGVEGEPFSSSATTDELGIAPFELPSMKRAYRLSVEHPAYAGFAQEFDLSKQKARGDVVRLEVTLSPPNAGDLFNRGVRAYQARDLAAAEAEFRRAVELDPAFARGWTVLAMTLLERKSPEQALAAAERAIAAGGDDAEAMRLRYDALVALDRREEAEAALDELAARDTSPELARLLFNAGAGAANAGDAERARRRLEQALERDPALWQAHSALAELEIRAERLEAALARLDQALAAAPDQTRVLERKVELLRALGREDDATAVEQRLAALRGEG